jgi:hypothetical protein
MQRTRFTRRFWTASLLILVGHATAWAQESRKVSEAPKDVTEKMATAADTLKGWNNAVRFSGTFSFTQSDNVVGAQDGSYFQGGVVLDGAWNHYGDRTTWENLLKAQLTQSRTPTIDAFIKSLDNFDVQTTYYYHLKQPSWIGPYARARLNTQLFKGFEIDAEDQVIRQVYLDGSQNTFLLPATEQFQLTSSFEPLILSQNVGLFASPPGSPGFRVKSKLGFGLQEIVVGDSAFAVQDVESTPEVEVNQLEQAVQGGAVLDVNVAGKPAQNVAWKVDTSIFLEAFTDSDIEANAFNMDLNGLFSVKLVKWASFDYVLLIKHIPRIVDRWQVQNGVVLTVGFDLL